MPSTDSPDTGRHRLQLSATQLIASALAAVTATVAASYLGINGTVIGAAIASVLTVAGNAIYSHSIHRTRDRVRTVVPVAMRSASPADDAEPTAVLPRAEPLRLEKATVRRLAFAAVGVFAATLAILTGVEIVAGSPVSDLVRGTSADGTTVFGSSTSTKSTPSQQPLPAVTVTQTVVPTVVTATPTVTQTRPAVTVTPTTTATPTASPTPTDPTASSGTPTP